MVVINANRCKNLNSGTAFLPAGHATTWPCPSALTIRIYLRILICILMESPTFRGKGSSCGIEVLYSGARCTEK